MDLEPRTWVNLGSVVVVLFVHWAGPRVQEWIFVSGARRARRRLALHEGGLEALVTRGRRRAFVPDMAGRLDLSSGTVVFRPHGQDVPLWWVRARDVTVRLPDVEPLTDVCSVVFHSPATGDLQISPARHRMSRAVGNVRVGLWVGPLTLDGSLELVDYVREHGGTVLDVTGLPLTDLESDDELGFDLR